MARVGVRDIVQRNALGMGAFYASSLPLLASACSLGAHSQASLARTIGGAVNVCSRLWRKRADGVLSNDLIGQAMARHAKLVRTMTRSAATTAQLSGAAARLAHRGLIPIHLRATANAKRLGKRQRRMHGS